MNLEQNYNREDFLSFLKSFVPKFSKDVRRATTNGLQVTKEVSYLGESSELNLSVFELTHSTSADARVALAMDGFRVMKNSATYRALVIYRADKGKDWRLSLMTATPGVNQKGKVNQVFSNPHRYSFFLGPDAKIVTPTKLLIEKGKIINFEDLLSRFSLEPVSKEFFTKISDFFYQLVGGEIERGNKTVKYKKTLILPSQDEKNDNIYHEFAVRLIGRIIFVWFLKHKKSENRISLVPEDFLSVRAIDKYPDYYHNILEKLFFEVLNTPQAQRKKNILPDNNIIPFLNGGLFNPHTYDFYEGQPSYNLKIPDKWFKEFFSVLEQYNFTIDENTTADVEIAVDPEMLGRIFENLLAEISPETGESARKATGSYYTPRTIVDYMVNQSLKYYLLGKTKISEEGINNLLNYNNQPITLSDKIKNDIVDALDDIKIIDPACGSGAFPMGILQKMLLILQKLDPNSTKWLEKQLNKIDNKLVRDKLENKLKRENWNYIHKLGIIQNAIYGVDIQPIAVDISKLRCFLTLIVDEKIEDEKENRGIIPLPNLEF